MTSLILAAVALAMPNATGFAATSISPTTPAIEQSGQPGATLYFPITITNNDSTAPVALTVTCDIATESCSNATAQTTISPSSVTIAASSTGTLMVSVAIQSNAVIGTSEILSIRFNDGGGEVSTISLIVHVTGACLLYTSPSPRD